MAKATATTAKLDTLRSWMLKNSVVSATVDGVSLTLHPSVFAATKKDVELDQPKGHEVELPEDLQDPGAMGLMFFSSHAGPPEEPESP